LHYRLSEKLLFVQESQHVRCTLKNTIYNNVYELSTKKDRVNHLSHLVYIKKTTNLPPHIYVLSRKYAENPDSSETLITHPALDPCNNHHTNAIVVHHVAAKGICQEKLETMLIQYLYKVKLD
jgi:hypothetical protein